MSHKKYASPLRLPLETSRILMIIAVFLHAGAIAFIAVSVMPVWVKVLLIVVTVGSFGIVLASNYRPSIIGRLNHYYSPVDYVVWNDNDEWVLVSSSVQEQRGVLMSSTFVHPYLTVVNLKLQEVPWYARVRSFVFVPDNIDAETFRHLRVRLRWCSGLDRNNSVATE